MAPETAVLVGAGSATTGWLYTARRQRHLARKQHTINIMLQASFNKEFGVALTTVGTCIRERNCPDLILPEQQQLVSYLRQVLNHYEFVAAGIRNGDLDERMVRDSERGSIVALFEMFHPYVYRMRDSRQRLTIYEHLEWLYNRWTTKRPGSAQRLVEFARGKPCQGRRVPVSP